MKRAPVQAGISCLKRDFGWRRSLFDEIGGTQTWCGRGCPGPQLGEDCGPGPRRHPAASHPVPAATSPDRPRHRPTHPHATSPKCCLTPGRPLLSPRPDASSLNGRKGDPEKPNGRGTRPHDPTGTNQPDPTRYRSGFFRVTLVKLAASQQTKAAGLRLAQPADIPSFSLPAEFWPRPAPPVRMVGRADGTDLCFAAGADRLCQHGRRP